MSRLIDADALKEHKFLSPQFVQIGGRRNGKTLENINRAYQKGWNDAIDAIIDNAPTGDQPTGEWIPVSERLPKMSGLYLVSIDDLVATLSFDGIGFRNKGGIRVEVSAWMPLPEPYRKGGEGE